MASAGEALSHLVVAPFERKNGPKALPRSAQPQPSAPPPHGTAGGAHLLLTKPVRSLKPENGNADHLFRGKSSVVRSSSNIQLYIQNAVLGSPSAAAAAFQQDQNSCFNLRYQQAGAAANHTTLEANRSASSTSFQHQQQRIAGGGTYTSIGSTRKSKERPPNHVGAVYGAASPYAAHAQNGSFRGKTNYPMVRRGDRLSSSQEGEQREQLREEGSGGSDGVAAAGSAATGWERDAGARSKEEDLDRRRRLCAILQRAEDLLNATNVNSWKEQAAARNGPQPTGPSRNRRPQSAGPSRPGTGPISSRVQLASANITGASSSSTTLDHSAALTGTHIKSARTLLESPPPKQPVAGSSDNTKHEKPRSCVLEKKARAGDARTFEDSNMRSVEKLDHGEGPEHLSQFDRFLPPPHLRGRDMQRSWGVQNRFKHLITYGSATPYGPSYYRYSAAISTRKTEGYEYQNLMRGTASFGIGERNKSDASQKAQRESPMYNVSEPIGKHARTTLFRRPSSAGSYFPPQNQNQNQLQLQEELQKQATGGATGEAGTGPAAAVTSASSSTRDPKQRASSAQRTNYPGPAEGAPSAAVLAARARNNMMPGPGQYPLPSCFDPPRGRYISPNLLRRPQSSYGKLESGAGAAGQGNKSSGRSGASAAGDSTGVVVKKTEARSASKGADVAADPAASRGSSKTEGSKARATQPRKPTITDKGSTPHRAANISNGNRNGKGERKQQSFVQAAVAAQSQIRSPDDVHVRSLTLTGGGNTPVIDGCVGLVLFGKDESSYSLDNDHEETSVPIGGTAATLGAAPGWMK